MTLDYKNKKQSINLLRAIQRPEYFFRPRQLWRRLRRHSARARNEVQLAWGLPIEVDPSSSVGVDIINLGVHDRVVPEAIWRLLDPGEHAYDVGANIGQNTSIMALKVGAQGSVVAFEPSLKAWDLLRKNVALWDRYDLSPITLVKLGLSWRNGSALLHEVGDLAGFSLEEQAARPLGAASTGASRVELITLDAHRGSAREIGLIKIDVEGHELAVLQGAAGTLRQKGVRDILFEDYHPQPSQVTVYLQMAGYSVFSLFANWRKPTLLTLDRLKPSRFEDRMHNFLATRDPERARNRFASGGWKCLYTRYRARPRE